MAENVSLRPDEERFGPVALSERPVDESGAISARQAAVHRSNRWTDAVILTVAIAVPLLGAAMVTVDRRQVAFQGFEAVPLPPLCASRWLGFDCPTCGLTRSIIALMAGRLSQSIEFHRFGWLIFLLIVGQIPYRLSRLFRPEWRFFTLERAGFQSMLVIGVLVVINWIVEICLAS